MRQIETPLTDEQIITLKQYAQQGEVGFIGPISDTMRPIKEFDGNWAILDNGNQINLKQTGPEDFAMITRFKL